MVAVCIYIDITTTFSCLQNKLPCSRTKNNERERHQRTMVTRVALAWWSRSANACMHAIQWFNPADPHN